MINKYKLFGLALCTLLVSACGKKTTDNERLRRSDPLDLTSSEARFKASQEIKLSLIENNLEAFKKAIEENPYIDLNQPASDGDTFLITAIKHDFKEIRDYLIRIGVNLEKPNINKETPLMIAALTKRVESLNILINNNIDLDKANSNGDTALHLAIKQNIDEVGVILVKRGANINQADRYGRSALKLAHEYRVPDTLAQIQAQIDLQYGVPDLARYKSIISNADYRRLEIIVGRYPKTVQENESINPLALLTMAPNETYAVRTALILLEHEANVNGPESADISPLLQATIARKKAITLLYLNYKANTEFLDREGKSALIHAIELNDLDLVDAFLAYSALEKYTFRKDGKKISYSACDVANKVRKRLTKTADRLVNRKIRYSLNCGFLGRFF